jgi:hypothetical protein
MWCARLPLIAEHGLEGDASNAPRPGITEYDRRFEEFLRKNSTLFREETFRSVSDRKPGDLA